uniref:Uncharacterized protein n=1 Tax=Ciona intestinalis TaxID=7719 RepID=H2Y294_CIOIN
MVGITGSDVISSATNNVNEPLTHKLSVP